MGWGYFFEREGDWGIDKNNPGQQGRYAGKWHKADPHIVAQLAYQGVIMSTRSLVCLEALGKIA